MFTQTAVIIDSPTFMIKQHQNAFLINNSLRNLANAKIIRGW
jgi:hypothetical protein